MSTLPTTTGQRFYWLDLMRFIAAMMVLLSHSRGDFFGDYGNLPESQKGILTMLFFSSTRLAHEAVLIFFVLSGYLVGGRAIERLRAGTFDLRSYTLDRTVRIMLPLVSAILLYIVVMLQFGEPIDWVTCVGNLFSLQGLFVEPLVTPFWSLSFEVWFYVLMGTIAVLFTAGQNRKGMNILSLIMLTVCMLVFVRMTFSYLFIWFLGAMAYVVRPAKPSRVLAAVYFLLTVALIGILQLTTDSVSVHIDVFDHLNRRMIEIVLSLCCCLFIQQIVMLKPGTRFSMGLNNLGTRLAAFSYTLYLVHRIVFLVLFRYWFTRDCGTVDLRSILLYILFVAIVMFVSYIIYIGFERNTDAVKRFIRKRFFSPKTVSNLPVTE